MKKSLAELVTGKTVIFVSPMDSEYIRNRQEVDLLKRVSAKTTVISATEGIQDVSPLSIRKIIGTLRRVMPYLNKPYDAIFIGGAPQVILPFIYPFIRKKILIVDFFVSIHDTLVHDRKKINEGGLLSKLLMCLDQFVISIAGHVVVDTLAHAEYFNRVFGLGGEKTTVLYLRADERIYFPRNVAKEDKWKHHFMVFFFGAMNPLQGVEQIVKCAELLLPENKIVFVLVGPIEKTKGIMEKLQKLPNIQHLANWLSQEKIANYIAMSDLCLAGHFSPDIPKAGRVIPGKAYIYLSMNKITVLGDNMANRELYNEADKRVRFVPMGNAEALADVILNEFNKTC